MKKVLIISSSIRAKSNSEILADSFARGASDAGNEVEIVSLKDKKLAFCKGCLACQKIGRCVIDDDANTIADKMEQADVIAFASPVYYYSISGQLKTMIDRVNSLYPKDYKFRDIYFLSTAAEDEEEAFEGAEKAIQGWIDCFEKAELKGTVYCGGVNDGGDIAGNTALQKAYDIGKSV